MKHKTKNQIFHEKKKLMPDKNLIEFDKRKKSIPDKNLIQLCKEAIKKMCNTGGKAFTMTVPVKIEDTDIILSELVERFEKSINSQPTPDVSHPKDFSNNLRAKIDSMTTEELQVILDKVESMNINTPDVKRVEKSVISDKAIDLAWGSANFGKNPNKRYIIIRAVQKCIDGWANGHTIQMIIQELGLVEPESKKATRLGLEFVKEYTTTPKSEGKERKLPTDKEIRERYDYLNESKAFQMIENNKSYWEYAAQWMRHKADKIIKSLD